MADDLPPPGAGAPAEDVPRLELRLQRLLEERLLASRRLAICQDQLHGALFRLRTGSQLRLAATSLTDLPSEVAPIVLAHLDPQSVARLACSCQLMRDMVRAPCHTRQPTEVHRAHNTQSTARPHTGTPTQLHFATACR
jgi:hypothetical protein